MVVGELEIRPTEYLALAAGKPLRLTVRELDLLTALAERRDRIVSREELYEAVWEEHYRKADRSVDVYIARLRQKLDEALPGRAYIHTHFGFGYRLSSAPPPDFTSFLQGGHSRITDWPPADASVRGMKKIIISMAACGVLALGVSACGGDDDDSGGTSNASSSGDLSGTIKIDGSSTVAPFAQAAQEAFQGENPNVKITVGTSGTGGGFEKFCAGETDISDASRPIKPDEEAPVCKKKGISYKEIQVANDGIAVVTNPDLKVDCMTTAQLKQLWNKGSKVKKLSEIDPKFPDTELTLFGPGTDSGTFDFFTEQINGEEGVSREDYQPSEDDNVLVQGVAGESGGLGYFGHSYYEQNKDKLNLVKVDGGDGCIEPTVKTIQTGEYKPLSRPLFMYPSTKALKRPEVDAFLQYIVDNYQAIADASQIVAMSSDQASKAEADVKADTGG